MPASERMFQCAGTFRIVDRTASGVDPGGGIAIAPDAVAGAALPASAALPAATATSAVPATPTKTEAKRGSPAVTRKDAATGLCFEPRKKLEGFTGRNHIPIPGGTRAGQRCAGCACGIDASRFDIIGA